MVCESVKKVMMEEEDGRESQKLKKRGLNKSSEEENL